MEIRNYKLEDKEKVIALLENVFPDDPPHNNPASVIEAKLKVDSLIFVAEIDGEIAGVAIAGYDGHRGWLYSVGVSSDMRRRGIGSKLVKHTMAQLKHLGCIKVNLQIRAANHHVEAFYRSLGFAVEERISMGAFL